MHSVTLGPEPLAEELDAAANAVIETGAVIVQGIIPPALADRMRDDLDRAMQDDLARYGPDHPFRGMVHALMVRGESFLDLLSVDAVRTLSRRILGGGAVVHAFNSSSLAPHETNYAGRIHVDSPRHVPGYVTNIGLAFPLDAFTHENGAMEIWPESFQFASPPSQEEFERNRVILAGLMPGDAVCFNARSWHQSGINRTSQWRRAATLNVCRAFMRQQFDYPRMIAPEAAAHLSEDVRRFLGYHVRMPVSIEEFLLPPDERPYRPGQE